MTSGRCRTKRLQLTEDSINGIDAAKIGMVLKCVPPELLEAEVEGLADRLSLIDPDLLSANKRITNPGLELMGAQTLQRLAAENDARAHRSDAVRNYGRSVRELAASSRPGRSRAWMRSPLSRSAPARLSMHFPSCRTDNSKGAVRRRKPGPDPRTARGEGYPTRIPLMM